MALAQLAAGIENGFPYRQCNVCYALENIDPNEAAGFEALLANPSIRYRHLSAMLAADPDTPLDITHAALAAHAKGECAKMRAAGKKLR